MPEPPKKRGRQNRNVDPLSREERETLQRILDTVHDFLQDLEEESTEPGVPNRGIIDPFLELPPKSQYPDYYQLIKQPIAMKQIENKINKKQYQSLKQFRQDIALLCNNCRQYNEDGSVLYNDANLIEVCYRPHSRQSFLADMNFTACLSRKASRRNSGASRVPRL
jgi:ATP-dependent helicase STH1/SNF2